VICDPCKQAGQFLFGPGAAANPNPEQLSYAKALHAECPGGSWCSCQHRTDTTLIPVMGSN
jgi:hypothetical protein